LLSIKTTTMKKKSFYAYYILTTVFVLTVNTSCNKQNYIADFINAKGYVIGKETCNSTGTKDYWVIDLTYLQNTPRYGDTLLLDGTAYTNVIKTKDLAESLQHVGMAVSLDFKVISANKIETSGCTTASPVTYSLKELSIINQGEIR